jgi:hypothetical protein
MTDVVPTRILTVRDLVVALQNEDQDALVVATWENVLRAITVYHAKDGTVLVDADHGDYRSDFEGADDVALFAAEQHQLEAERTR